MATANGRPSLPPSASAARRKTAWPSSKPAAARPEIEEHVTKALRFLKQTQAPDGGWGSDHRAAMTGLSLLAYLGHCETPLSEEFGDSCLKAMVFLIDRAAKQDGRFPDPAAGRHWPYEQAIATYALAEAHTFCRALNLNIPNLAETVQRSGQMLIDRQHESGGWDYDYEEDSSRGGDLSITAWHIQALKACKLSGIDFRNLTRCLKSSLDYVEARQAADGSFGYTGTTPAGELPRPSLTGAGMLCLQMGGRESSGAVRKGARHALENSPFTWDGPDCDLYAHYYLAQAMFQRGGKDWAAYQPRIRDSLTARQSPDGSWPKPGGGGKVHAVGALFTGDSPDRHPLPDHPRHPDAGSLLPLSPRDPLKSKRNCMVFPAPAHLGLGLATTWR